MTSLGMHPAGGQDRDGVDVLARQELADVISGRNAELRRDSVGARPLRITDRDQTSALDMIAAEQLGVMLRDPSTSEQAQILSRTSPGQRRPVLHTTWNRIRVDVTSILIEGSVNQAIAPARRPCGCLAAPEHSMNSFPWPDRRSVPDLDSGSAQVRRRRHTELSLFFGTNYT